MWIEKEITIGGKKVNAQVNQSNGMIELEIVFDLKLANANSVTIDLKDDKIISIDDVGEREETLKIIVEEKNNEHEPNKSRETTKLSK